MSEAVRKSMTVADFLDWAERQPEGERYELVNGVPVAMAPERAGHNNAKLAAALALMSAIRRAGVKCFICTDGMTVPVDEQTAFEPDALVYCGERVADNSIVIPNPIVVVEVVSPSTRHVDAGIKLTGYFRLASVAHYLIVDAARKAVVHHRRGSDAVITTAIVSDGKLSLHPPGLEVPVAELFVEL